MGILDWLLLAVLALGAWRGFQHGFVHELSHVLAWVLAFVAGVLFMDAAGSRVTVSLGLSARVAPLVGFLLVFVLALTAIALLTRALAAFFRSTRLGAINRLLGGIMGGIKTLLLLSLLLWALDVGRVVPEHWKARTTLYGPVKEVGAWVWARAQVWWPELQEWADEVAWPSDGAKNTVE